MPLPLSHFPAVRAARSYGTGMFAVQFDRFGPPGVLTFGPFPEPHAGPGQVRIRVEATGVSPVDTALRAGRSQSRPPLPHVPGVDAAGTVDEVGPGVTGVSVGDEVFGAVDLSRLGGANAEFAVLRFWAGKPRALSWPEAGGAATSVETATRALDVLDVRPGMVVLVDSAAGGVGSTAVQLARARGARVIGAARPDHADFVTSLGAEFVPYGPGLPERVAMADRALHIGGSLAELVALTGDPAAVVTITDLGGADRGVHVTLGALAGQPSGKHGLTAAAALAEEGRFRLPVADAVPMPEAAKAHSLVEQGGLRGKVVLVR